MRSRGRGQVRLATEGKDSLSAHAVFEYRHLADGESVRFPRLEHSASTAPSAPLWLFGDQLGPHFHSTSEHIQREVLLIESARVCRTRPFHRQKLHLLRSRAGYWSFVYRDRDRLAKNHRTARQVSQMHRLADLDQVLEQESQREVF